MENSKLSEKTGIYDDVTGMECTPLDCFVNFNTTYDEYQDEIRERGIAGIGYYFTPGIIQKAYEVAEFLLEREPDNKMVKQTIARLRAMKSCVKDIKVGDEYQQSIIDKISLVFNSINV